MRTPTRQPEMSLIWLSEESEKLKSFLLFTTPDCVDYLLKKLAQRHCTFLAPRIRTMRDRKRINKDWQVREDRHINKIEFCL